MTSRMLKEAAVILCQGGQELSRRGQEREMWDPHRCVLGGGEQFDASPAQVPG